MFTREIFRAGWKIGRTPIAPIAGPYWWNGLVSESSKITLRRVPAPIATLISPVSGPDLDGTLLEVVVKWVAA